MGPSRYAAAIGAFMPRDHVSIALSLLRNSAALAVVGVLAKAMGLVLAVLVARFLGPAGLGLFALLFSVTVLVEQISLIGLPDVLVRDIGARPAFATALWRDALGLGARFSLIPALGFLVAAFLFRAQEQASASLILIAIGMPLATVAGVGQAVLQSTDRVLYVTWISFLARVVSLLVIVVLLYGGAGVPAAFISRIVFQGISALAFAAAVSRSWRSEQASAGKGRLLADALPFAINRAVTALNIRAPLLLLPLLFSLHQVGLFDAADRIRLTIQMTIAASALAIVPVLSHSVAAEESHKDALVSYTIKYVCLLIAVGAGSIAVFADSIVRILYGSGYSESVGLLRVLLLAQIIGATDTVVRQVMVVHGRAYTVVWSVAISVAAMALLILGLGTTFGLPGAAVAVLICTLLSLVIDLRLITRKLVRLDIMRFVVKPLACVMAVGGALVVVANATVGVRLVSVVLTFLCMALALNLFPQEERQFVRLTLARIFGMGRPVKAPRP